MSFTLRSVSVYSLKGDCRTISFRPSGLNILSGEQRTGKSSVIDILDYCFGRSECFVAEGDIRRKVSWFGVEIARTDDALFIGRRNPPPPKQTSPDIFIRRGRYPTPPPLSSLHKNITEDALIRLLTRFAGIPENEDRPLQGTRGPLQATIRHALFFCFQRQDEIASRERLFHRQGDQYIPDTIKRTIPYFLGAIDEDHFALQNDLDEANRTLRKLQAERDARESDSERASARIRRYVLEARRVGLIDPDFEPVDFPSALEALRRATSVELRSPTLFTESRDLITRLEDELRTLHQELTDTQNDIRALTHFIREHTSYSTEVNEQRTRLSSLGLFNSDSDSDAICPLCETPLDAPTPSASELAQSLRDLERQLQAVALDSPHLQARVDSLRTRKADLESVIVATQTDLEQAYADDERARQQRDGVIERARSIGRISAFLDQVSATEEDSYDAARIEELGRLIHTLEDRLDSGSTDEMVFTFLNLISDTMSRYAREIELEHADDRIRLDLKNLSVVADTVDGPIPLSRIGSGANWVGYHVVTLMALHNWFRTNARPVPGILVLDQPSQAHYPPDVDQRAGVDLLKDSDRRAVHNLFSLMHSAAAEMGEGFQLIVLDHARFEDDWFRRDLVDDWRDGVALVPRGWVSG